MEYRRLGRTGLKVSSISLGSWQTFGRTCDQATTNGIVKTAFGSGINFFDTADIYDFGVTEEVLGKSLRGYPRKSFVLASKCFWPMNQADPNSRGLSRKHILESIDDSLERLKTPYLDLYQCHRFDPDSDLRETVYAMEDLVTMGKILYWGVSVWNTEQMKRATEIARERGGYGPISNQPQYNMLYREIELDALPGAQALGMGTIIWSPLAQGMLTGKYKDPADRPKGSRASDDDSNTYLLEYMSKQNFEVVQKLKLIAQELGCTLPQLALAWCLHQPGISSTIIGATREEHVIENTQASKIKLSNEILLKIAKILPNP